jgi:hypothetical protein
MPSDMIVVLSPALLDLCLPALLARPWRQRADRVWASLNEWKISRSRDRSRLLLFKDASLAFYQGPTASTGQGLTCSLSGQAAIAP